ELDPDDKEARARLEQFEMVLGSGNLLDIYEDSYNKDPNNPEYAWKYGNELLILGEFVKAVPVFQQYLKIKPEGFDAYSKLGEAYYGDLQYKKAIANYNAYLKRNAQDYSAMVKLGDIYREQQSLQTAVNYAYKALRIKAGYGEAYILIGKTYRDAVSYCSSKREKSGISYDDKLVYEKAYYVLAKALKDPESAGRAENLRRNLKVSIPTKSEKFLHQNRTKIRGKCYSWIK
ncbi:MAG: tetratricopeptide repeat protein, partial [Calditrichia bacterium]|nr:tetratricopeptide repeat protein [Calditrichia bacterium]